MTTYLINHLRIPGVGGLVRLVLAWRHRRARQAADLLLLPEPERVWARAILAYYNRVGDPSV